MRCPAEARSFIDPDRAGAKEDRSIPTYSLLPVHAGAWGEGARHLDAEPGAELRVVRQGAPRAYAAQAR